jgi:ATP-binding cassette, subfamily C (CFTR/MRP), member 4
VALCLIMFIRAIVIFKIILRSGTNMHTKMTESILRTNIVFFDSNPIGRIINRFAKDMGIFDLVMPAMAVFVSGGAFRVIAVLITVSVVNPWISLVTLFVLVCCGLLSKHVLPAMIESQRMDTLYRGPVHTSFAMVVSGLITLRAYKKIDYFKIDFSRNMEKGADVVFCNIIAQRWLGIRIDLIVFVFGVATCAISIVMKDSLESQLVAFSLQSITDMIPMVSLVVRMGSEFENFMTSS